MPCRLAHEPFDDVPPQGIVGITKRKSPDTMQVIREKDEGVNRKRVLRVDLFEGSPQGGRKWSVG
jgi:hypothetical protein